jgi:hypothetical protein
MSTANPQPCGTPPSTSFDQNFTRRTVTTIIAAVVGLALLFGFGNVWGPGTTLGRHTLGDPTGRSGRRPVRHRPPPGHLARRPPVRQPSPAPPGTTAPGVLQPDHTRPERDRAPDRRTQHTGTAAFDAVGLQQRAERRPSLSRQTNSRRRTRRCSRHPPPRRTASCDVPGKKTSATGPNTDAPSQQKHSANASALDLHDHECLSPSSAATPAMLNPLAKAHGPNRDLDKFHARALAARADAQVEAS